MIEARTLDGWRGAFAALLLALLFLFAIPAEAKEPRFGDANIAVELYADGAPVAGQEWMLALRFTPSAPEWHGYWSNPGDAGQGMSLDLDLPDDWTIGKPLYPVPHKLVIAGLMNHIYEGEYVVLVPVKVGDSVNTLDLDRVSGFIEFLACTDRICVPQDASLSPRQGGDFDSWRSAIVPQLDSKAGFEIAKGQLRIGIPLPAALGLPDPHIFIETTAFPGGARADYAAVQTFIREGDLLVAEVPLKYWEGEGSPPQIDGILSFGDDEGVRFTAEPADVPLEGAKPIRGGADTPSLAILILAALGGGLLLNIMPCVFPILSLKAIALAKAGGAEEAARRDALAYTAGVVIACAVLGAFVLALRAAGEQIGWAFQLQEPAVVVALFVLAMLITANFLGLFAIPGLAIIGGKPSATGSFATGLLAAFVATPCSGPFMALALGAAIVLPPLEGLLIFTMLGFGLALPFLLVGFVPAFRRRLPKPGAWMERFRRWMALPMGLTALALAWLVWRIGGSWFAVLAIVLALSSVLALSVVWSARHEAGSKSRWAVVSAALVAVASVIAMPGVKDTGAGQAVEDSLLDPAPFSEAALAKARSSGKPVFVWFTADWCVTCKVNESVAIEREETRAAFEQAGVVTLRGDWTRRDEEIASFLARHGAAGVPLYLWYQPGGDAEQMPQVLTQALLVQKAQGAGQGGSVQSTRPEPGSR